MFELLLCCGLFSSAPALSNGEDSGCFPAGPAPHTHLALEEWECFPVRCPGVLALTWGEKMSLLPPQLWGLALLPVDPMGDADAPLKEHGKWKAH